MKAANATFLIVGVMIGAALTYLAMQRDAESDPDLLIWTYMRNTGPEKWTDEKNQDPSRAETLSEFAIKTANECGLTNWHLDSSENVTDIDVSAAITLPFDDLTKAQFNCLASRVRPPYVTLARVSADPQKRTAF